MKLIKISNFLYFGMIFIGALLINGCGKKTPPPPPRSQPELVLGILDALKQKKHDIALKKLERLRELEPTNVFLANLEILERNNAIIVQAQDEINDGNLSGALEKVNEGIRKHGRHKDLVTASKKLAIATRISEILDVFKHPRDSAGLRKAALQLKEIGTKYSPAKPFVPLAEQKLVLAKKMDVWETRRAIESFCSFLDEMLDQEDQDVPVLFAVLEVTDPYNPTLLNYLDYLKGHDELSLKTYNDEDVFSTDFSEDETTGEIKNSDVKEKIKTEEKTIENKDKKPEKKKGWWNNFTF